jgi:5-methylcytosine-specific restriction enzyme subunit McrC
MILYEWQSKQNPFSGNQLDRFNSYLLNVWDNRNKYVDIGQDSINVEANNIAVNQNFFNFSFDGKISAKNYVGVVQFEGIRIEVTPKILKNRTDIVNLNWKHNLLFWLSYCQRIKFPFSFADISTLDFEDFLELLIYVFAHYTENLISNQPYQNYQPIEEELSFLKGRLVFDSYIKNNLATGKWQNFTCQHQPFVYDNSFNRIVKYVSKRLLNISNHFFNQEKLRSILFILDEVADVQCVASDCDKVKLNPLFSEHKNTLDLCKMYLSNQMMDTENPESNNFCFLVPMEYVFEDFVFGFLNSHFKEYNFISQSTAYLATNESDNVFQIKNDIYIPKFLVIDTKYKIRQYDDGFKNGVVQTDMYQMVSYALVRSCSFVQLIYPFYPASNNEDVTFNIKSENLKDSINVKVININIVFDDFTKAIDSLILALKKMLEQ